MKFEIKDKFKTSSGLIYEVSPCSIFYKELVLVTPGLAYDSDEYDTFYITRKRLEEAVEYGSLVKI